MALRVFLLLALVASVRTQGCQVWGGDPPECAPYLAGQDVYIYGPVPQSVIADQIRNLTNQIVEQVLPLLPACANKSLPFACYNAFPKCVRANTSLGEVEVWQPQCRAVCDAVNSACLVAYQFANTSALNCSADNAFIPIYPFYPPTSINFTITPSEEVVSDCDASLIAGLPANTCPMTYLGVQLVPIPQEELADYWHERGADIQLPCWKCPFPSFYTKTRLHLMWYGTAAIGAVSILVGLFTMFPIIFVPSRRSFPTVVPLHLAISGHGLAWTWVATAMRGHVETFCENDYTSARPSSAGCVIMGFCLLVFSLASIYWTTAIIFNVFWSVVLQREVRKWWYYWQLAACWGLPLLHGVLYLALRQAYYNEGANCFIADYHPGTMHFVKPYWITYFLWYIPIASLLIFNTCIIISIVVVCFRGARDWTMAKRLLKNQWRTFAYFVFFFYTAGYVTFLWVHIEASREKVSNSLTLYVTCLFTSSNSVECKPAANPPVNAAVGLAWTNAFIGIWFFLIFGLSTEHLSWWKRVVTGIITCEFSQLSASWAGSSRRTGSTSSRPSAWEPTASVGGESGVVSRL